MNVQKAYATFYGVVGKITVNKDHAHVMLFVNAANRHGQQIGRKIFNIYLFDTAFSSSSQYIGVGDHVRFDNVEIEINDADNKIFFRVKYSTDVLIIAKENRQILQERYNQF